ncbi:hypothetical protein ACFV9C_13305 [Kribbella sp. NPDC059898]|uniref:hypothetical protein n=1 Tax=Kribbella sp. NPDC059898 TaxID=3346995 RepID=UPI003667517D
MRLDWKAWQVPLRLATGGFILNSGMSMLAKDGIALVVDTLDARIRRHRPIAKT